MFEDVKAFYFVVICELNYHIILSTSCHSVFVV